MMYVADFEKAVAQEARRRGYDGDVCGHIQRAEMRDIDGILYCNDGDWVERCSALIEHHDGQLELRHWCAPVQTTSTETIAMQIKRAVRYLRGCNSYVVTIFSLI